MNRGGVTLLAGLSWAGIGVVLAGLTSYFTAQATTNEKINNTATVIYSSISQDRERIATVEEAIKTIKDSQLETRSDVKEILRRVK